MGRLRFHAVSTFHKEGLDLYGRRMVETFSKFWTADCALTIYADGWCEDLGRGALFDLYESSPWLAEFKKRHAGRRFKDFRWDAIRFAHKVAAVLHTARTTEAEYLIWVDGDVVTHSPVSLSDLEGLAPDDGQWIAWLDRAKAYPECGFYILNLRHPQNDEMLASLETMYEGDELFALAEFHDSFVLEQVVKRAGVGTKSLSQEARTTSHPLINGPLGRWLDHLKGPRKQAGRSHKHDLRVKRTEAYWK